MGLASASDHSSDSESDTPIMKKKRSSGSKAESDDFAFKNVLRPPRSTTYTAQALYDQIIEGTIDLDPHYQRDVVWSEIKQIGLVDSIFRNFYIPPIIFAVSQSSDGTERRVCIDGKQRLTSIQKFMDGLIFHKDEETKRKYWYKQKTGKPGKQLPPKYKRMFANKQIVCIEYMEISEDDEREIFRRVQLGMALNYAEKMKAEAPTPRQALVHDLVAEFAMSFRSLGFNDRRDAAFRWIAQSLQTILDSRPFLKRTATTTSQQTAWLKDAAPLDLAWKKRVQHTYQLLVDTLSAHPDCLQVAHGPATIAPIDLVMMVLLVFEFHEKLPAIRLPDALHALRMAARNETKDLMWKTEHLGYYVVFLERLERLGEAVLNTSSDLSAQVLMDVDPPAKRQRTDDYTPALPPTPSSSQPPPAVGLGTAQRTPTSFSVKKGHTQEAQLQPQSTLMPRPAHVPPPLLSSVFPSTATTSVTFPTTPLTPIPPQQQTAFPPTPTVTVPGSMLGSYPFPLSSMTPGRTDRLAAMRAAKAIIQHTQQQQQQQQAAYGSHSLPHKPAQTQMSRPSAEWPVVQMSGNGVGTSLGGGVGGPSGSGGGGGSGVGGRK
ncbi:hypothetical protein B0F90DRAFT_1770838 [Multifurca ochricompacta]|uniref:GmrSD restriction endonucleases N-terminal domain-containing protein n=1 Tax=Multifurca ochricompacta TaxID=376703 RepID=A0AAD4LY28_9AGAM|nr:hypothetical protein B0F90DRAFT_1770838 [Multifurca ochricompacta]